MNASVLPSNEELLAQNQVLPSNRALMAARTTVAEEPTEQATGVVSSFTGGVKRGIDQTQALLGGAAGLVGTGLDIEGLESWGQETYRENMKEAQRYVPKEGAATFAESDSATDYANWAAGTLGELMPTMAVSMAGGGAGGFVGKTLLGNAVKGLMVKGKVADVIAGKIVGEGAKKALKRAALPAVAGQVVGAATATTALESGGIYGTQVFGEDLTEQNEPDVGLALLYGVPAGMLDAIVPARLLGKLGIGRGAGQAVTDVLGDRKKRETLAGALRGALETAPMEGLTEVGQGILERAAQMDYEGILDTPEGLDQVFDSEQALEEFMAGLLGGGVAGGAAGALQGRRQAAAKDAKERTLMGELEGRKKLETTQKRNEAEVAVAQKKWEAQVGPSPEQKAAAEVREQEIQQAEEGTFPPPMETAPERQERIDTLFPQEPPAKGPALTGQLIDVKPEWPSEVVLPEDLPVSTELTNEYDTFMQDEQRKKALQLSPQEREGRVRQMEDAERTQARADLRAQVEGGRKDVEGLVEKMPLIPVTSTSTALDTPEMRKLRRQLQGDRISGPLIDGVTESRRLERELGTEAEPGQQVAGTKLIWERDAETIPGDQTQPGAERKVPVGTGVPGAGRTDIQRQQEIERAAGRAAQEGKGKRAKADEKKRVTEERAERLQEESRFAGMASVASSEPVPGIQYTVGGRGLLNNQVLDRSKLTDNEEAELVDLMDLGLQQPRGVGADQKFFFTPEGEKKHARLLKLLKKAAIGPVQRTEHLVAPSWESGDGQLAGEVTSGMASVADVAPETRTVEQAEARLSQGLGAGTVRRAKRDGFLKVLGPEEWAKQSEFGGDAKKAAGTNGLFRPKGNNGQPQVLVRSTATEDVLAIALHETEHAGMGKPETSEGILGASYGAIQNQLERLERAGDERVLAASKRAEQSVQFWRRKQKGAIDPAKEQSIRQRERLAYFIQGAQLRENEKATGVLKRVLDSVRAWWRTTETGKAWAGRGTKELTDGMALALAKRAFKVEVAKAGMGSKGPGSGLESGDIMPSLTEGYSEGLQTLITKAGGDMKAVSQRLETASAHPVTKRVAHGRGVLHFVTQDELKEPLFHEIVNGFYDPETKTFLTRAEAHKIVRGELEVDPIPNQMAQELEMLESQELRRRQAVTGAEPEVPGIEVEMASVAEPGSQWFSQVGRTVAKAPQEKMAAGQWLGWLKKQKGVKQEEVEDLGLAEWLAEKKGAVTKQEVGEFVEQEGTPEFKSWFRDSKVVDDKGKPLVVYHGTKKDFSAFKARFPDGLIFFSTNPQFAGAWPEGSGGKGDLREPSTEAKGITEQMRKREKEISNEIMGEWDTFQKLSDAEQTARYDRAKVQFQKEFGFRNPYDYEGKAGIRTMPVYLSIQKPFDPRVNWPEMEDFIRKNVSAGLVEQGAHKAGNWLVYESEEVINELKRRGYDGLWIAENIGGPHETIAAFEPTQIKSAVGNRGAFDPNDPDIMASVGMSASAPLYAIPPSTARSADLNAEIKSKPTVMKRVKDVLRRGWAPGGHLSKYAPGAHSEIIEAGSSQNMWDAKAEQLVHDLERSVKDATGVKLRDQDEAFKKNVDSALKGSDRALRRLPAKAQDDVGAMREYLDHFSREYADAIAEGANLNIKEWETAQKDVAKLKVELAELPKGEDRDALRKKLQRRTSEMNKLEKAAVDQSGLVEIIRTNLGKWVNRSFRVFDDKNWYQNVSPDALDEARAYLMEEENMSEKEAQVYMMEKLKDMTAFDSFEDWVSSGGKIGTLDLWILRKKDMSIPEPILALLGEYKDPSVNFAKSAAKVTRLVHNTRLLQRLKKVGLHNKWLAEAKDLIRDPKMHHTLQGGKGYEPLAGLKTYPEVEQGLKDILGHQPWPPWLENVVQVTSFVKRQKTIYSPAPTGIRNYVSSPMALIANADLNWQGLNEAVGAWNEYIWNKDLGQQRDHLRHIQILGVSYDTPFAGELQDLEKDTKLKDAMLAEGAPGGRKGLGLAMYRIGQNVNRAMTRGYQFGDDFVKITAFRSKYGNLEKYIGARTRKQYAEETKPNQTEWENTIIGDIKLKQDEEGAWGFRDQFGNNIVEGEKSWGTQEEASADAVDVLTKWHIEKMAAERIRNTYQTYSLVGRTPRFLRKFPLTGTFVSFPVEMIRTVSNMVGYIQSDLKDPDLRPMAIRQMVGMTLVASMAYGAEEWARAALGVDDDELDAARESGSLWNQFSNMVPVGRDERGRLQLVDFGYVDLYAMWHTLPNALMSGQPIDEALSKAAVQLASPFVGIDITAGAVNELLNNRKSGGGKIWEPESDTEPQQAWKIAKHMLKTAAPSTLVQAEKVFRASQGVSTTWGEKLDPMTELKALGGWKVQTVDPARMLNYGQMDFQMRGKDVTYGLGKTVGDPNDVEQGELEGAVRQALIARAENYERMIRKVRAAKKLGMTKAQMGTQLRRLGLGRRDTAALVNEQVPPWRPGLKLFARKVEKARLLFKDTPEKWREIEARRRTVLGMIRAGG